MYDKELKILREAFLAVADPVTSCQPTTYRELQAKGELTSVLQFHCGAVATVLRGILGGDIVTGKINGITHYWNRLPNNQEVDLTSCQFGGDGFTPLKKGRRVHRKDGETANVKFILFAERVKRQLRLPIAPALQDADA